MSSLMQHHGCTTKPQRGKVELLMYLVHQEEEPMKCMNCGREVFFPLEREHFCGTCGQLIGDVFHRSIEQNRVNPAMSSHWMMHKHWSDELNAQCRASKYKYIYAANCWREVTTETVELTKPDGSIMREPKLYRIFRKPVGMWGCWVEFRWCGEVHVPDLSVPIRVEKLPRDAVALTDEESVKYWIS